LSIFSLSVALSPEYLADLIPGSPFRRSTTRPESSAIEISPVALAVSDAFIIAFSSKVLPVSLTSRSSGKSLIAINPASSSPRRRLNSLILPLFLLAITISIG